MEFIKTIQDSQGRAHDVLIDYLPQLGFAEAYYPSQGSIRVDVIHLEVLHRPGHPESIFKNWREYADVVREWRERADVVLFPKVKKWFDENPDQLK